MSEPEHFLARWARRKRDAADAGKDAAGRPEEAADSQAVAQADAAGERAASPVPGEPGPVEPAFDLASLPPIESITAETDIRGFLTPGVPAELKRAALRQAWSADPVIRGFVGLAENDWDFNKPESIPGFGRLEMTPALRREVARIVGDLVEAAEEAPGQDVQVSEPSDTTGQTAEVPASAAVVSASAEEESGIRNRSELSAQDYTAAQQEIPTETPAENLPSPARRSHGRALPQ